jgi:catechol 2,3-dioxygenase-like lactoylglutathione lyase family enzyme
MSPPAINGIYETALYAPDILATAAFYAEILGLRLLRPANHQAAVFRLGPDAMLLLFEPTSSDQPGRGVPVHGSRGPGHVALRIRNEDYEPFRAWLLSVGIAIELERSWSPGGRSIYFRDPAGNSVELAAGEVWGN